MENQMLLEKLDKRARTNTLLLVIALVLLVSLILFAVYGYVSVKNAMATFTAEYNKLKAVAETFDLAGLNEMLNGLGEVDFDALMQTVESLDPELMNSALEQLGSIDIDALNDAVATLNKLGGTFGKFFG